MWNSTKQINILAQLVEEYLQFLVLNGIPSIGVQAATKEELVHSGKKLHDTHSNYQVCPSFVFLGFSEVKHFSVELWK